MASNTPRIDRLESFKNLAINGNFDFWQRGTSFASASTGYTADRFKLDKSATSSVYTISRSTNIPTIAQSGFKSSYSLRAEVTTADASMDAADRVLLLSVLEGYDFAALHRKSGRLSFWVRSNKTGTYSIAFNSNSNARSYVTTYTIDAADTWEKKTIDLEFDNQDSGWLFDNSHGVQVVWALMNGSNLQTATLNEWQSANVLSSTTQVNHADTIGNYFELSQVMLIPGEFESTADIPFSRAGKNIAEELAMCQRYYQRLNVSNQINWLFVGAATGAILRVSNFPLAAALRTSPTMSLIDTETGTSTTTIKNLRRLTDGTNIANPTISSIAPSGYDSFQACIPLTIGTSAAITIGLGYMMDLDDRLITFDAEF